MMADQGLAGATRDPASFRDPSGFVYRRDGRLYRQIDRSFGSRWEDLHGSGLLRALQAERLLIPHEMVDLGMAAQSETAYAVIEPELVPFLSYPFEWSFGALKDAALLTLRVQAIAMAAGFTLRDATAYNVQFVGVTPILIDSLSFERAEHGAPWQAYRQFCEQFVAPLSLIAYRDARCGMMLREFLDGVPLDLASRLLPWRTRFRSGLLSHIHAHARAQGRFASDAAPRKPRPLSALQQRAFFDSLRRTIEGLDYQPVGTEWADYADNTSYADSAAQSKDEIVRAMLTVAGGQTVWDLGANTGRFSRIAAELGRRVIAWDIDPAATERHYIALRDGGHPSVLPLIQDLANPSPGLGWASAERRSLQDRADADVVLALALVHHLAIGRNVPLEMIAALFAQLAPEAIVEFVPKADPMARLLLATRDDIFPSYDLDGFRDAFLRHWHIVEERPIADSERVLFHLSRAT